MKITKEQVITAMKIIEDYKKQVFNELIEVEQIQNEQLDKRNIDCLGLETRELNNLRRTNVNTVGELLNVNRRDLIRFRNMGKRGVGLINKALKDDGIETEPFKIR
jgi:DNA-directed RNA polymerase alpha subunit